MLSVVKYIHQTPLTHVKRDKPREIKGKGGKIQTIIFIKENYRIVKLFLSLQCNQEMGASFLLNDGEILLLSAIEIW